MSVKEIYPAIGIAQKKDAIPLCATTVGSENATASGIVRPQTNRTASRAENPTNHSVT
jgi:hypothetical protein